MLFILKELLKKFGNIVTSYLLKDNIKKSIKIYKKISIKSTYNSVKMEKEFLDSPN
jgi:type I site-specific restriction-modification system R (restriction) subunit